MIRGRHEKPLIKLVRRYFENKGYTTQAHAQLNIAWATMFSDVDVLARKGRQIIAVEVKSRQDVFQKAFLQLDRIAPFVDRTYIATDDLRKANSFRNVDSQCGIIHIDSEKNSIVVKKRPIPSYSPPPVEYISHMKRCCLQELAKEFAIPTRQSKPYIALDLRRTVSPVLLRRRLKWFTTSGKCPHLTR